MNVVEIVRFAVAGLVANRLRSLLTMLGIIIGIAAVILLTALGNGAAVYIQGQISGLGANSITIIPRAAGGSAGSTSGASARSLTSEDASAIADPQGAPDVAYVAPVVQTSAQAAAGRSTTTATVVGSTPDYFPGSSTPITWNGTLSRRTVCPSGTESTPNTSSATVRPIRATLRAASRSAAS